MGEAKVQILLGEFLFSTPSLSLLLLLGGANFFRHLMDNALHYDRFFQLSGLSEKAMSK